MNEYTCGVCGKNLVSLRGVYRHARMTHKIGTKEYYDRFIDTSNHKCPYCKVNDLKWHGYYYGKSCDNKICEHKVSVNASTLIDQKEKVKRIKFTKLERHGSPTYNNSTKIKQTLNERYDTDCSFKIEQVKTAINEKWNKLYGGHPMKCEQTKNRLEQSMLDKYGYRNASQVPGICSKKSKHKYECDGLHFDSLAELKVYEYCKQNSMNICYEPKSIEYIDSFNISHQYIPDFEINGKLYEVKGDYLLTEYDTLYFPYRNTLNESELARIDARDEAKTKCMKDNNVIIIRTSQIDELDEIFKK